MIYVNEDGITGFTFCWRPDLVFGLQISQHLIIDGKEKFITMTLPDYDTCEEFYNILKKKFETAK